jgi:excisionase family DNA binding protein
MIVCLKGRFEALPCSEATWKCLDCTEVHLESIPRSAITLKKEEFKMTLHTLREAAERLRISLRTIHSLLKRRELRRIKVSGRHFITEDEITRFLSEAVAAAA